LVAGGGSGGIGTYVGGAGGGGAGGLILDPTKSISGPVNIVIGAGGSYKTSAGAGNNGGDSIFDNLTVKGGGGGGSWCDGPCLSAAAAPTGSSGALYVGLAGGSGGGSGSGLTTVSSRAISVATDVSGTTASFYGNVGGNTTAGSSYAGAGGGGAGSAGTDGGGDRIGNGGAGIESSITGTALWYAGGGGGSAGSSNSYVGAGGSSVGGSGSQSGSSKAAGNGSANTGSGGGGVQSAINTNSGAGGSGIAIVAYSFGGIDEQSLIISTGSGSVTIQGNVGDISNLTINSNTASSVSGVISGTGTVIKQGSGTLTFTGTNTYSGSTTISAGTLSVTGRLGSGTYAGAIINSGTLEMASSSNQELAGIISGTGNIIKSGSGDLTLSAVNTYSGSTTISNGQLNIYAESGLGATPDTFVADQLIFNSGSIFNANGANIVLSANRGVTLAGSANIIVNNGSFITIEGVITGPGSLTLSNAISGILTLSATNSYEGLTTISGGTLHITNALGLGSASAGTVVADGRTLQISNGIIVAEPITINGSGESNIGAIYFESGNNTYSGAITLGSNSTITSAAGNQTISGTINGAYTLGIAAAGNWTQSGIVGGLTPLTGYSIDAGANNIVLAASSTVAGNITLLATTSSGAVTINSGTITATGDNRTIVIASGGDFDNNSGSGALVASGTGSRWIIYTADNDVAANFGSLNSNNTAVWGATYSSLVPASVSTGNRYVFAESATQVITFTTTDENKIYGNTATITDNYTIASSGIAGLENVYNEIVSGGAVSISDVFSVNPTFVTTDLSDNSSDGTVVAANVGTYKIIASDGTIKSGYSVSFVNSGQLTISKKDITVTAANKTKSYGDSNPSLTFTTDADLTGLASVSGSLATTATTTTTVSDVAITQGTVINTNNSNYNITFVNGTLRINKLDIEVTAENKTKTYGEANPVLTFTVDENLAGLVDIVGDITTIATDTTNVGDVAITQ
jgi:autotransporter-associated beta strand protein